MLAEFAIRRLNFNVDALISQCVKASNATTCTTFKKLAEGQMNPRRPMCMRTHKESRHI